MPFEGNYYISRKYLQTDRFKVNYIPGLCPYKFFYVWLDLLLPDGSRSKKLGWMYWFPNPLLPFIWYRVAVSKAHPELVVEEYTQAALNSNINPGLSTANRSTVAAYNI